jgi:NTP pyrophosphatase (non-canonical NTP hydrolase)
VNETLVILQEEAAEVIQAISKIHRFGIGNTNPLTNENNLDNLHKEIGDLQCMINLCIEQGIIDPTRIKNQIGIKREKLKSWSNISS